MADLTDSRAKTKRSLKDIMEQKVKIDDLGIPPSIIYDIIYRILFNEGEVSVARMSDIIKVHAQVIDDVLTRLQQDHQVEVAKTGTIGRFSYIWRLTDEGTGRARDSMERGQYIGPAPVNLEDYSEAVLIQTGNTERITPDQVNKALGGLILPDNFHRKIGPAVNAGTSLFLYGPPGNGKTTVAEACAALLAGTEPVWLPYATTVGGQVVQIFDAIVHKPVKNEAFAKKFGRVDKRWVMMERPAVMVGGELTMDAIELRFDPIAKFYEAPLQMKANTGMFLIDDFGRQQISPQELLNRWIVPLETRIDFLRLQTGQTLEMPFRQLIVFSTNLDPSDLTDAAFLRRIQMKVEVTSPSEKMYYQIFRIMCNIYKINFDQPSFLHLLNKWYRETGRVLQSVHPRDILKTIMSICEYVGEKPRMTPTLIDEACESYFVDA